MTVPHFDYYLQTDWMHAAACRGKHDVVNFFPNKSESDAAAKALCSICQVIVPCFLYAMDDPTLMGVWAGTTANSRERLRRLPPPPS